MKWITRLFNRLVHGHDLGEAVAQARHYHWLGLACARRGQPASARQCRQLRDARLWEARKLARKPPVG